ncbi:ABC transporter permease [Paractinoplanes brasiliensis]|uniref:Uncharacterized protein n=1 Tax=Paractinoplanes brasiliensis TaxID=52695 RepID=A0A4R6JPY3_9ACTN|nr:ABC transporter permease [Actinoplanes brasiliensis]TDO38389.1 hypothetical protein C8E87_2042 [Actinoplanes brasiliensis]GID26835.1 ABC transporter permease [Actinoplanes brasiliensis]
MTAPATTRSAYPRNVEDLIPHARDLAEQLGTVPSRNKLMKTFRVGADKANALIDALTAAPVSAVPVSPAVPPIQPAPLPLPEPIEAAEPPEANEASEPTAEAVTQAVAPARKPIVWPVLILCLPAFIAIWGGWVEMGRLTGFGMVKLLPGIVDNFEINTAITLPIGVETYAAYALYAWLSGRATGEARTFAKWSALASLALGAFGQVAYHLMSAAGWTTAPWPITAAVACIPVAVLGMGAALAHLMHRN